MVNEKPWYETRFRGFLLDFQIPENEEQMTIGQSSNLRNLDVEKICDQLVKAHVKTAYIHAKDATGNCYYNTKVGHKHRGIGDRDMIADFIRGLHKRDIKVILYVCIGPDMRAWEYDLMKPHLDSRTRDEKDLMTPSRHSPRDYICCLVGPYREYLIAILKELTANYNLDGYWLDWPAMGLLCRCDFCRGKFREDTGLEVPEKVDWNSNLWRVYFEWRKRLNNEIMKELKETVKSIKPHVTVTHNATGIFWAWVDVEKFFDNDDYLSHEYHSSAGLGSLGRLCRMLRASGGGKWFEVEVWRFLSASIPGTVQREYQVKPLEMYETEILSVLAHGGIIQFYDQINLDGTLEPRVIELLEKSYAEVMKREKWLIDAEPVKFAALYWSKYTNDYYGRDDKYSNYASSVYGAHYSMMEDHIPFDVVMDRQLNAESLSEYKVLVMPNAACLSDEQAEAVRTYVQNGGGLVATYRTSLENRFGQPRRDFALGNVFNARYVEPVSYLYSYFKIMKEHPVTLGVNAEMPLSVFKTLQLKVTPLEDANVLGNIVYPYRGFIMGHPPLELTDYPGIIVSQFGKGRAVYFAGRIDSVYDLYGHPDYKRLLVNAIKWAAGTRAPLEVEAPTTVETTIFKQPEKNRIIVHLINYTSAGSPQLRGWLIREVIPVHDITVRVKVPKGEAIKRIYLAPEKEEAKYRVKNGYAEIKIPKLDIHRMVVLEH